MTTITTTLLHYNSATGREERTPITLRQHEDGYLEAVTIGCMSADDWIYIHPVIKHGGKYDKPRSRNKNKKRAQYIVTLLSDVRLFSRARHTQTALIEMVMADQQVKRNNAKIMISRARKVAQAKGA